jgi:hypothetical protein
MLGRIELQDDRLNLLPQVIRHFPDGVQLLAFLHNSHHPLEYGESINPNQDSFNVLR